MKKKGKNILTVLLMTLVCFSASMSFGPFGMEAGAAEGRKNYQNPSGTGSDVTYDCVWFGSYPQAEVVLSGTYSALSADLLQSGDIIQDDTIYNQLKSATWNSKNETTLGGEKYRRIKKSDSVTTAASTYVWSDESTYHYFKYQPIKWRVLSVRNGEMLLLSDKVLDDVHYNSARTNVTWANSSARMWLLGGTCTYTNGSSCDYTNNNFINSAFTGSEYSAIAAAKHTGRHIYFQTTETEGETTDMVFLLADYEVYGADAAAYGFDTDSSSPDLARVCKASTYAKAKGVVCNTTDEVYLGNCSWVLRSPGIQATSTEKAVYPLTVYNSGLVRGDSSTMLSEIRGTNGIRPAIVLKTSSLLYNDAGTVRADGNVAEVHCFTYMGANWNASGSACTMKMVCKSCQAVENINAKVTSQVLTAATISAMGTSRCKATISYGGKEYTDTKDFVNIKQVASVSAVTSAYTRDLNGGSFSVSVKTNSNGALVYSSSNNAVATVSSSGIVTPKGKGTAVISAYAKETSQFAKSAAATINVKIIQDGMYAAYLRFPKSKVIIPVSVYYKVDGTSYVINEKKTHKFVNTRIAQKAPAKAYVYKKASLKNNRVVFKLKKNEKFYPIKFKIAGKYTYVYVKNSTKKKKGWMIFLTKSLKITKEAS